MKDRPFGRYLVFAMKSALSIGLLAAAVGMLDWNTLLESLSKISPAALALTVAVLLLEFPVLGCRWHLLVRDHNHLGMARQLRTYFIAVFFNNFTPGQLGGDIYRFTHNYKAGTSRKILAALLIRERLIGLAGHLVFFLICYAAEGFGKNIPKGPGADLIHVSAFFTAIALLCLIALPFLAPFLAAFSNKFSNRWCKLLAEVGMETTKIGPPGLIVAIMTLTLLGVGVIWVGAVKVVALDLGVDASFFVLGMIAILANLLRLVPITIQGVGVREAVFAGLFGAFGMLPEDGFLVGLIVYACVSLATVAIGVIGKLMPQKELEL